MKRLEVRDLYYCCWKVRIPKKQSTKPNNVAEGDRTASGQQNGSEDQLWRHLMNLSKQPKGESIVDFLDEEKKETIKEEHLWVPVSDINFYVSQY